MHNSNSSSEDWIRGAGIFYRYLISPDGEIVYSLRGKIKPCEVHIQNGSKFVNLKTTDGSRKKNLRNLIATTYFDILPAGHKLISLDGDVLNVRVSNLKYVEKLQRHINLKGKYYRAHISYSVFRKRGIGSFNTELEAIEAIETTIEFLASFKEWEGYAYNKSMYNIDIKGRVFDSSGNKNKLDK